MFCQRNATALNRWLYRIVFHLLCRLAFGR
jgi:hypothetical protein